MTIGLSIVRLKLDKRIPNDFGCSVELMEALGAVTFLSESFLDPLISYTLIINSA